MHKCTIFGPATTVLFIEVSLFQRVLIRGVPLYSENCRIAHKDMHSMCQLAVVLF